MRSLLDRVLLALCRLLLRVFFRRLEIVGRENLPRGDQQPWIVVANHGNSLIDPLLVIGALPRMPRMLAKSTLWKKPSLRIWLQLAAVIPVYRKQDDVDTAQNQQMFSRCHELLRDGGVMSLFPEGISHDEPYLQPLKTGAARIALEAGERFAQEVPGGLDVRIIPMGLDFEEKTRFRSRALVRIGKPLRASTYQAAYAERGFETVRELTADIEAALRDVTVNTETWEQAHLIRRAADLTARLDREAPGELPLAERAELSQQFIASYQRLRETKPARLEGLAEQVRAYNALLDATGLRDDQVGARYPLTLVLRYLLRSVLLLLFHLPLAMVGTVLNYLPYRLSGWFADRFAEEPEQPATYKLFSGLFLFPVTWLALALAFGLGAFGLFSSNLGSGNFWIGLGIGLLAPLSGWIALRFHEQRRRFQAEVRAYLKLRTRQRTADELRRRRRAIYREVEELAKATENA